MLWNILLLALVSCALLVSVQALTLSDIPWMDMKERLKDRVIHVESLYNRGRWLWRNDVTDKDGSHYLYIDRVAERDTYYEPKVQFQTRLCANNKYLCLESLHSPNYYLAAGFPPKSEVRTVKLAYSTYTQDNNQFHWKIMCKTLQLCKFIPVRFDGYMMITDPYDSDEEHHDATLALEEWALIYGVFEVHAPNPTDGQVQILVNTNEGSSEQLAKYTTTIGVSQTETTSETVTDTTSVEIGGAFKAFSASASSSISNSWTTTSSSTYEAAKTVEHDITLPPRTKVVLKQLKGNYAGQFTVGEDEYTIEEQPLDSGATRTRTVRFKPDRRSKKEEL